MKRLLILVVLAAAACGVYFYVNDIRSSENGSVKPKGKQPDTPVYEQKLNKKDYEGAYTEARETIEKTKIPEDPGLYYTAAVSALELGREKEAEEFAGILISPDLRKNLSAQKKALMLGNEFYKRFVAGEEPNWDFWMITRDLLGIGLHSRPENTKEVIEKITKLNAIIEFSGQIVKGTVRYTIKRGETLDRIAQKFNTNASMLVRINDNIDNPNVVHAGQTIKVVPGGNYTVIVDKSQFKLTVYRDGIYIKSYPVGVGKEGEETPTGTTSIFTRQIHPPWTRIGKPAVHYGDPEYPLGERWMSFDKEHFAHYGIHGTNDDSTIGKKSSNGCIRLTNSDVIELYDLITIGTKVVIQE